MTEPTTSQDTIVAPATANGRAGVSVIRISGVDAKRIGEQICAKALRPRHATLASFSDQAGDVLDSGLVLYFPAPNSYTGEDVVELQGHGSPVVVDALIRRADELGARLARPGEFSERAFLNDKMDLAQAEAVADLIDAGSKQAAKAAMRSLQGEFSAAVFELTERVIQLRLHVEAAIDFPEEEIDFLDDAALRTRLDQVDLAFTHLQAQVQTGRALTDGLQIVLAGAPNVGKSSLLNSLVGDDAAIVTDVAGTTRDLIRESLVIDGLPIALIDTAGLRTTDDPVEQEGVRRTHRAIATADHALLMIDATVADVATAAAALRASVPAELDFSVVLNKVDLIGQAPSVARIQLENYSASLLALSAKTGDGVGLLRSHLLEIAGIGGSAEGSFSARRRHVVLLEEARGHFDAGVHQLRTSKAGELMAEELRLCQQSLAGITGAFSSDDLLGRIFSSFCIGK
ncbi:MAG: tRNA uridine-5-carboxymethylaminomethyl(34) synthesis GTPase MnmE [Pseudomonadota bacterium]